VAASAPRILFVRDEPLAPRTHLLRAMDRGERVMFELEHQLVDLRESSRIMG
jgi:hypothetical protein